MNVRTSRSQTWLLLTLTLPTKRASQRVEIWRKLQRYGTVALGNSGYLLPNNASNEERFQWLATSIRKYGGDASLVHVESIDNLSVPQLIGRFSEARTREYQELIQEVEAFSSKRAGGRSVGHLSRLRNRFQEIAEIDFFNSPCKGVSKNYWSARDLCKDRGVRCKPARSTRETTKVGCGLLDRGPELIVARQLGSFNASLTPKHDLLLPQKIECRPAPFRSTCFTKKASATAATTSPLKPLKGSFKSAIPGLP